MTPDEEHATRARLHGKAKPPTGTPRPEISRIPQQPRTRDEPSNAARLRDDEGLHASANARAGLRQQPRTRDDANAHAEPSGAAHLRAGESLRAGLRARLPDAARVRAAAASNAAATGARTAGLFGFDTAPEDAALVIVGVPWEPTVSYGRGTSHTPARIVQASQQVDLYDGFAARSVGAEVALAKPNEDWRAANERACAAARRGAVDDVNAACARLHAELRAQVEELLRAGKRVGVLGGEHACSLGALQAVARAHGEIGVLQIDAHHDLRAAYEGYRYSHASAMANVLDEVPEVAKLVAVGVRDYALEERARAAAEPRVTTFYDRALAAGRFRGRAWHAQCVEIVELLPERVYLSFDVDGLDPRFCPHTGTPVPGGLDFREATHLLETLRASGRRLVGFDLCEVAPAAARAEADGARRAAEDWDLNVAARLLHKFAALSLA